MRWPVCKRRRNKVRGHGTPPEGNGGDPTPIPVPPGANESQVYMSDYRTMILEFFGISAWDTPWNVNAIGMPSGTYGINRYCAYAGSNNRSTELTYLVSGAASYTDFRTWVDYHKDRGADLIVQAWDNGSYGAATSLTAPQWATYKSNLQTLITQSAGDVKYFVLANEPLFAGAPGDNPGEGTSQGWPSRSARLYAQVARFVKQVILQSAYPNIKVIGPELMSLDSFRRSIGIYVMDTDASGPDAGLGIGTGTKMKDFVDIFGFHGYHYDGGSFAPIDGGYAFIQSMKSELAGIGWTGPLWDTEWMRTAGGSMFGDSWATILEQMARRHAAEVAAGVGHNCLFEYGSGGPYSYFNDNSAAGVKARNWLAAYTAWWLAAPIGRIALLTDNRIRVTRSDGATLTIPTNLTDGTFGPNP